VNELCKLTAAIGCLREGLLHNHYLGDPNKSCENTLPQSKETKNRKKKTINNKKHKQEFKEKRRLLLLTVLNFFKQKIMRASPHESSRSANRMTVQ